MFYLCLFVYLQRYGNKQLQCWLICGKIVPFFCGVFICAV